MNRTRWAWLLGLLAAAGLILAAPVTNASATTATPTATAGSGSDIYTCPTVASGNGWSRFHCGPIAFINAQPSVGTAKVDAETYLAFGTWRPQLDRLDSLNGLKQWRFYCRRADGTNSAAKWVFNAYHVTQADMNAAWGSECAADAGQSGITLVVSDTWNGCGPYETVVQIPAYPVTGSPNTIGGQPERWSGC
jgi:hypothetical protein